MQFLMKIKLPSYLGEARKSFFLFVIMMTKSTNITEMDLALLFYPFKHLMTSTIISSSKICSVFLRKKSFHSPTLTNKRKGCQMGVLARPVHPTIYAFGLKSMMDGIIARPNMHHHLHSHTGTSQKITGIE